MIGKEVSPDFDGSHVQTERWIGKPWRRITLIVDDFYWKGERSERTWDVSFHLGFHVLGIFLNWSIAHSHSAGYDYYSEERP